MTPDFEEKQSGFSSILLWIFAGTALFMFLGLNALWGSESHWAEVAREMLVTGDFLHPAVNWQIFRNEPLFSYWETVPFIKLFGADELSVRLPVAITALFGLFAAFALAKKLFDRSTALLSSWMLLSTYGFLFWGRTASVECLGMTSAILAVFWFFHAEEKSPWFKYPVFYLFLCAGASAQGMYAALLPIIFLLPHLLSGNRWSRELKFGNFLSLLTAVLLYTLPYYLAWIIPPVQGLSGYESAVTPLSDFFSSGNLIQIFSFAGGGNGYFSCLLNLPRLLLPWLPFFAVAVVGAVADWKNLDRKYKDFWLGILLLILFFTLNPPRRWSYILPLAPFCCIITSAMFYRKEESRDFTVLTKIMYWVVVFAASLAFAVPVMLPVFQLMFKKLPPLLVMLSLPLAGFAVIVVCIMDNEPGNKIEHLCGIPHRLASSVVGMAVLMAVGLGAVRPGMTVYRTGKPFIKRLLPHIAGIPGKNIVFYETDSTADFQFYLRWNGPATIVRSGELAGFLRRTAGEQVAIICLDRETLITGLKSALMAAGISTKFLVPVEKETGTGKNWTLFLIDVPEEVDGQPDEKLSADNDKMQQNSVITK